MEKQVLVTYASQYGSTREIADFIGKTLREHGIPVDVLPSDSVTSLRAYLTVVVGSAVYEGEWLDSTVRFLREFAPELEQRDVWLFSSGPVSAASANTACAMSTFPASLAPLIKRIKPRDATVFAGKLDARNLTLLQWLQYRDLRGATGDYRDWQIVRSWAVMIAESLPHFVLH